jgi:hypothetical protein
MSAFFVLSSTATQRCYRKLSQPSGEFMTVRAIVHQLPLYWKSVTPFAMHERQWAGAITGY